MIYLAQVNVVPPVPWPTIAFVGLGLLAIILIIASLLWAWNQFCEARDRNSGKHRSMQIEQQPIAVSKASKRYNHDLNEERHERIEAKLKEHDQELQRLDAALDQKVSAISKQITDMPGKIVADIKNAANLFKTGGGQ